MSKKRNNASSPKQKQELLTYNFNFNDEQKLAIEYISKYRIIVLRGKAGVGKTYVALAKGLELLKAEQIKRIILTRPIVTTESLGFMPGDLMEKYHPFLTPIIEFTDKFGYEFGDMCEKDKILPRPIAYMRGVTFEDAYVIVDECQNITPKQTKMILTRIGKGSKIVFTGDTSQSDIRGKTGLDYLMYLANRPKLKHVLVDMKLNIVEREDFIQDLIEEWDEAEQVLSAGETYVNNQHAFIQE